MSKDNSPQYMAEQALVVGPKAHVHVKNVQFNKSSGDTGTDPIKLADELAQLRSAIRDDTTASADDRDRAVGALLAAEVAAKKEDEVGTSNALRQVGKWVLRVGESIGVALATAAIRTSLGI